MSSPATGVLALIAIGTPANGRSSPGSIRSAAASAPSASTSMKALMRPSRSSIRSSAAVTTSRARSSPPLTWAASSPTLMAMRSLIRGARLDHPAAPSKCHDPGHRCNRLKRYDPVMGGARYWYWLGGRPALDLVNTRRERWRRNFECLTSDRDAVEWLVTAGLLPAPAPAPRGLGQEARILRESIDAGVRSAIAGVPVEPRALGIIDEWLALAGARPALTLGPDGLPLLGEHPARSPRRALALVALDAAHMLGTPEQRARVRICGSSTCSARFYD